nr:hypothetical protein B0A51_04546 [Rachicladosporium sp. CCFEE 5018]
MVPRAAVFSVPPPVKLRLSRSKSGKRDQSPDGEVLKTSYLELNRPHVRQQLKKQLSGTFETSRKSSLEAGRKPSHDSAVSADNMGSKDATKASQSRPALTVGANPSAKSSTSTLNSIGAARRLSVLQEGQTIDVEAAINLLQELKKQASPEELVALHRALLPTREIETVTSPKLAEEGVDRYSAVFTQSSTRRSSKLPPGLATRGGFDEDVLRKPENAVTPKKSKSVIEHTITTSSWGHRHGAGSVNSLAALDLAEDTPAFGSSRPETPDQRYVHAGGYAPGTLRITNGAASPEPMRAMEQVRADAHNAAVSRASLDFHPGHTEHRDLPLRERILQSASDRASRELVAPLSIRRSLGLTPSSPVPLQITTDAPEEDYAPGSSVSPLSVRNDGPVSRQRSRERMSAVSAEYSSDCEISESPRELRTIMNFASRLSTVYGEDQEPEDANDGTPEAALARLAGHGSRDAPQEPHKAPVHDNNDGRPTPPPHVDSGYGSDGSDRARRIAEKERLLNERLASDTPSPPPHAEHTVTTTFAMSSILEGENDDAKSFKSLYTFKEFLTSPGLRTENAPPMPSPLSGKRPPLLHALRSKSLTNRSSVAATTALPESTGVLSSTTTIESKPKSKRVSKAPKPARKLQKPLPAHLQSKEAAARKEGVREFAPKLELEIPAPSMGYGVPAADEPTRPPMMARTFSEKLTNAPEMIDLQALETGPNEYRRAVPMASQRQDAPAEHVTLNGYDATNTAPASVLTRGRPLPPSPHESPVESKKSSGMFRFRSKSRSESATRSSDDGVSGNVTMTTSDFSSVTAALGSGPYDLSTNQFQRLNPSNNKAGPQSPWQISTGLSKAKSTTGMNEEAASELARSKSRDVAGMDLVPSNDRPRMATPISSQTGQQGQGKMNAKQVKNSKSTKSLRSVEDSFPEWQSKQDAPRLSAAQEQHAKHLSMYAESIPPMPEMPIDIGKRAAKADELMAKKMGGSPCSSARASVEVHHHVTVTTTAITAKGKRSHKVQELDLAEEKAANAQLLATLAPAVRAKATDADIQIAVRELDGSNSELSSVDHSRPTSAEDDKIQAYAGAPSSPSHSATHPGWPGWEKQAQLWRSHRESIAASSTAQSPPATTDYLSRVRASRPGLSTSPAIVVSRYITPLGSDNAARVNVGPDPTSAAARHADAYRDLLDEQTDDKENQLVQVGKVQTSRTDSAFGNTTTSTQTYTTISSAVYSNNSNKEIRVQPTTRDPRPAKQDVPRFDSAFSAKSYATTTTTTSNLSSSAPGKQSYTPYNPSYATASNFNVNNPFTLSRGLIASHSAASSTESLTKGSGIVVDRYSGGLQYEWERGAGFGGSAGTRLSGSGSPGGARRGGGLAGSYGVDLGDVPVFLQRG